MVELGPHIQQEISSLQPEQHNFLRELAYSANFEVLPTKKAVELTAKIPMHNSISVTSRVTGIENTIAFVESMNRPVIPNIAFNRFTSREHLYDASDRVTAKGVTAITALGGDGKPSRPDLFPHSLAGVQALAKHGVVFDTAFGAYPLGNISMDKDPTWVLLEKQKAFEHMTIVTQMTPRPHDVITYVEQLQKAGVNADVVVGIPGAMSAKTMKNLILNSGFWENQKVLLHKPKLVLDLIRMSLQQFDPVPYMVELARIAKKEHRIIGVRIFTIGSITASVKSVLSLLE